MKATKMLDLPVFSGLWPKKMAYIKLTCVLCSKGAQEFEPICCIRVDLIASFKSWWSELSSCCFWSSIVGEILALFIVVQPKNILFGQLGRRAIEDLFDI